MCVAEKEIISASHSAREKKLDLSLIQAFTFQKRISRSVKGFGLDLDSIHMNHSAAQPSLFLLSIPLFIYSSVHLSILACGQRAMSLCGPDNLDQFPLQFISQPITHLVKQHQAPQGGVTHPSKPLSNNHIQFFFPPQVSDL